MPKTRQSSSFYLTREARNDLNEIWAFIARDNKEAAIKFIGKLREQFHLLAKNPNIGTNRHELQENVQSWAYKKYVIFFRKRGDEIEIYKVFNSSRDIPAFFENLKKQFGE